MIYEVDRIEKAREVIAKIVKGVDPLTGEIFKEDNFLNDPRIIRCFHYITEVLDNVRNGSYSKGAGKFAKFVITPEQKSKIVLTEGKIGVNEFSRCINECVDIGSKKLTGVELNRKLRKLGVLGEEPAQEGKTKTTTNERSFGYGFEMEKRNFKGTEYDAIVINDKGKRYLLENLEAIMNTAV